VLTVTAVPDAAAVDVTPPNGAAVRLPVGAKRQAAFPHTDRAGLYRVRQIPGPESLVAANLLDRRETALAPRRSIALGGVERKAVSDVVESNREVWRWAAALALLLLCVEWLVYTRGIAR
jgi:hypothetical protein